MRVAPTEAEVRADQELAVQILAASVLAPLNLLGPVGAAGATIATPIEMRIASTVVTRLSQRRVSMTMPSPTTSRILPSGDNAATYGRRLGHLIASAAPMSSLG